MLRPGQADRRRGYRNRQWHPLRTRCCRLWSYESSVPVRCESPAMRYGRCERVSRSVFAITATYLSVDFPRSFAVFYLKCVEHSQASAPADGHLTSQSVATIWRLQGLRLRPDRRTRGPSGSLQHQGRHGGSVPSRSNFDTSSSRIPDRQRKTRMELCLWTRKHGVRSRVDESGKRAVEARDRW